MLKCENLTDGQMVEERRGQLVEGAADLGESG